jgi:hypothetical protein
VFVQLMELITNKVLSGIKLPMRCDPFVMRNTVCMRAEALFADRNVLPSYNSSA